LNIESSGGGQVSKGGFAPGLRSLFGGLGSLSHFFIKSTEFMTSTFDIHYSIFAFSKFLFRLFRTFFSGRRWRSYETPSCRTWHSVNFSCWV